MRLPRSRPPTFLLGVDPSARGRRGADVEASYTAALDPFAAGRRDAHRDLPTGSNL